MNPSHFTAYSDTLKALDKKRFQKVLDLYGKELRPYRYNQIKDHINKDKKLSQVAKDKMLTFNDHIYNEFFASKAFTKNVNDFSIGDIVYNLADTKQKPKTIEEFLITDDGTFAIFDNYSVLNPPVMLELLSKEDKTKDQISYFYPLKESLKQSTNNYFITEITSSVDFMLEEFAQGTYDFNPVYQRDLVWTTDQKKAFVKSLMLGQTTLRPTFIEVKEHFKYEILDGKQRMSAVIQYIRNTFSIDGYYFKDLSTVDRRLLLQAPMIYKVIRYVNPKTGQTKMPLTEKINLFLEINEYGQHVSDKHLKTIKEKYLNN